MPKSKSITICIVSDFFCPNTGGVESHIYYLGQCLVQMGHKVIVVTHTYGARRGIRYLSNGLKVYYLPFLEIYNGCTLPTLFASLPLLRHVFSRERVQIVHGHSSFSALAHEAMFHAQSMDIPTVFTDHSLFGFADASSILTNKVMQFSLCNCDHVICVSHTSKENTVLRARLYPQNVSVIPNAIYSEMFEPSRTRLTSDKVTIVTIGRLVYRRGSDLLAALIPKVCELYDNVNFLIGGDGPKRVLFEEMRDKFQLHDKVTLLGSLPHTQVRDVMIRGQIYLNCSLTEAFCITIVEAASCGLFVISTRVGGVPEVLPEDLMKLTEPNLDSVLSALCETIDEYQAGRIVINRQNNHRRVKQMYYWPNVAKRTERVYYTVLNAPRPTLRRKLKSYSRCGLVFGFVFSMLAALNQILLLLIDHVQPLISAKS